ncbi:Heterokaryon incompatibility protein (HET)-like protein [Elsinoe fawcettii]|nr:Heterokaryon incompatibility protein (HET)-like protein [Elsinoe fawcettii]
MTVSQNLYDFIWVDQICINQIDNEEKAGQVRRMTLLYGRAKTVLAWIGHQRGDTPLAIEWIEKLSALTKGLGNDVFKDYDNDEERRKLETSEAIAEETAAEMGVPFDDDAAWTAFSAFYDKAWFERFWIVQEVLPAREAWLICGEHKVEWHKVKAAATWYTNKALRIHRQYDFRDIDGIHHCDTMNLPWRPRLGFEFIGDLLGQQVRPTYRWAFEEMLTTFSYRRCKDPRDKIFALTGISSMSESANDGLLAPDYTKDLMTVYRDAVQGVVSKEAGDALDILLTGISRPPLVGWPSWVPDWRRDADSDGCAGGRLPRDYGRGLPRFEPLQDATETEHELHVRGVKLGRIIHLSERCHMRELLLNLRAEREECLRVYQDHFGPATTTPSGHAIGTAWTMSIHGGRLHKGVLERGTTEDELSAVIVSMVDTMRLPHSTPEEEADRQTQLDKYMYGIGLRPDWLNYLSHRYCLRRWVILDTGHIGLAHHRCRIGDDVAVLWGLSTACTVSKLSPDDVSNADARFKLVGEAYCHGGYDLVQDRLRGDDAGENISEKFILV